MSLLKNRIKRHDVIRSVIREKEIRTQKDLVDALRQLGYKCTQATVSRDINDMGLEKTSGGAYMLKEDLHLKRLLAGFVQNVARAHNLIVVKTRSGMAQGVAAAIDAAQLEDALGTIAGDDTILIVALDEKKAELAVRIINELRVDRDYAVGEETGSL